MTRLFVDEREIAFPIAGKSLDEILKHVEDTELGPDSVIRHVRLDGTCIGGDSDQQPLPIQPAEVAERKKIEIFTASIGQIARDSVGEAISYLERVETVIPSLAASFQSYPGPEAFGNLKQLYEGFYWLNLLVDRLERVFRIVPEDVLIRGVSVKEQHERLASILRQLVESQEKGDFILISDLLEYEILPFIPAWKEIFSIFGAGNSHV